MERLLFECALRATLIAAGTVAALWALRIKNVVALHHAWTGVVLFMLALPLWTALGYRIPLRVLPPLMQQSERVVPASAGTVPVVNPQTNEPPPTMTAGYFNAKSDGSWQWIEGIYTFGACALLLRLITGMVGAHLLRRRAGLLDGRLTSTSCLSPITVGWLRAVTILPDDWREWPQAKLDAVLAHENEHSRRHDPFFQWLALLNRAIFWFHPLAWWLERRLAALSEEACDIAVLEHGHDPGDYAEYLLDLARSVMGARRRIRTLGMTMPGPYLPQRIQKMLKGVQAQKISRLRMCIGAVVFSVLSIVFTGGTLAHAPLAFASPKAAPTEAQVSAAIAAPSRPSIERRGEVSSVAPQASTQQPEVRTPKFEVASVKPCAPGDGAGGGRGGVGGRGYVTSPGRLYVNCMSVSEMMNTYAQSSDADHLVNDSSGPQDAKRVRGGPAWVYSDRYTVNAETSDSAAAGPTEGLSPASKLMMGAMLRALLEERFQLRAHQEIEELPMYSLTIAKGGLKIQPMEEGGCIQRDLSKGVFVSELFPPGEKPLCVSHLGWDDTNWKLDSAGQPLSNLANWLSTVTGRHVFDKTGTKDLFTLHLTFAHDDSTPGEFSSGRSPFPPSDVPSGPSVFTVLEQQLGLRLVPDRGPRGHLVIDHVERPSEN